MELDEFKTIVKTRMTASERETPAVLLEKFRRRRTRAVVEKIRRSLWLEAVFAFVFMLIASYVVVASESRYVQAFVLTMLAFSVFFVWYLSGLYLQIRRHESRLSPVRIMIADLIDILKKFTALYFQLTMILMPLIFILAFLIGYLNSGMLFMHILPVKALLTYLAVSICWIVLMYFFTKWYIRRMYGNYLKNLLSRLEELENGQ